MNIHAITIRRLLAAIVIGTMVGWFGVSGVQAAPPSLINYQGRLRTAGGTAITDATTIQFSIYNHATNGASTDSASEAGALLWKETYSTGSGSCAQIDPDANGYFTAQLGNCSAFPSYLDFTQGTLYVGIKIGSDSEASPRMRLLSHPYALNANRLGDFVDTGSSAMRGEAIGTATALTQGYNSPQVLLQGSGWTGAAAANREMKLQNTVIDASNYRLTVLNNSDTALFTLTDDGLVGISDATPESTLDINVASGDATFSISDPDVAHGLTGWMETDAYVSFTPYSSTAGGLDLRSTSDTDATAMAIRAVIGSTNPTDTTPGLIIGSAKSDGTTGVAALGSAETVMQVVNYTTTLATWLGSGALGLNDTTPDYTLEVAVASGDSSLALSDPDVAHGMTTYLQTDSFIKIGPVSSTAGGTSILGASDAAGTIGLSLDGAIGVTDPTDTTPAIKIGAAKSDGLGGVQALAAAETSLRVDNYTSTGLLTILGDGKTGLGDTTPDYTLEVTVASGDPSLALSDPDVAHGVTDLAQTDAFVYLKPLSSTAGGLDLTSFSDTSASALSLGGVIGSADPTDTTAAVLISGAKKDAGTSYQALGNSETVLQIWNATTAIATWLGNGNLGLRDTTPDYSLEVSSFAGGSTTFALSDADLAHGITSLDQTDVYFSINPADVTNGGAVMRGFSAAASKVGINIGGIMVADPTDTTPAIYLAGAKSDGGTSIAVLGNAETVLQIGNATTPLVTVLGDGKMGIGDTVPANGGLVVAAGVTIGTDSSNNLIDDASNGAGSTTLYIGNSSINVTASDIRLKENITPSTINGLAVINELNVKDFDWKPGTKWFGRGRATGLIAQEVYDILPQVVDRPADPNSTWSIEYHHLVPYLIKAMQEQQAMIEALQLANQPATTLNATDPTFGGALELTSQLAFGVDTVGQAVIQTNDERVTVTFAQPYAYLPVVTVTPIGLFGGQYAVDNITFAGFDIVVADPVMTDTTFGWHVFGAKQGKVYSSDGSVTDLVAKETTVAVPSSASSSAAPEPSAEVLTDDESGTSAEVVPTEEPTEIAVTESPAPPADESASAETVVTESAAPADESTAPSDTATEGVTEAPSDTASPATGEASAPATTDAI